MIGTVKWFDQQKGFGFITCDGGHPDVFVHHTGIVGPRGRKNLFEQQRVEFRIEKGERGPKAVNVTSLHDQPHLNAAAATEKLFTPGK